MKKSKEYDLDSNIYIESYKGVKAIYILPIFNYIYKTNKFVSIFEIVEFFKIEDLIVLEAFKIIRKSIQKFDLPYDYLKTKYGIKIIDKVV